MRIDWNSFIQAVEGNLNTGQLGVARRELRKLKGVKVPRSQARQIAYLARQANMALFAIRVLNPIVRPLKDRVSDASQEERAEYAACLSKIGAAEEALELLSELDGEQSPMVWQYGAFAQISQWDYRAAIPSLMKYIDARGVSERDRLLGQLNLAAALVAEREHGRATHLLKALLKATLSPKLTRFHGNVLEISTQNALFQKDFAGAERFLRSAFARLQGTGTLDELFVGKWQAVLALWRKRDSGSLRSLHRIRSAAMAWPHWETVRDCDRWEAVCGKRTALLTHVYFGTPYPSFRKRLLAEVGEGFKVPEEYLWLVGGGKQAPITIDLFAGTASGRNRRLKVGQALHRLLVHLSSDFYRPFRLASLHFRLYPKTFFNPLTSPLRVHQVIWRLRDWFQESRLPLSVDENGNAYRLKALGPIAISISNQQSLGRRESSLLVVLRGKVGNESFSAQQASRLLGLHPRQARRLLFEAVAGGDLVRSGGGPTTRYCFGG